MVGPSAIGSFVKVNGDLLRPGDRLATLNAALLRFLDAELGAGFGEVEIPPDLRTTGRAKG